MDSRGELLLARSSESGDAPPRFQSLADHLNGVAALAREFALRFDSGDWGFLAGLWHDLGKCDPEFQRRLRGERIAVEHSGLGAALAFARDRDRGLALAAAIAGHHAGLPNLKSSGEGLPRALMSRLQDNTPRLDTLGPTMPREWLDRSLPEWPAAFAPPASAAPKDREAWLRRFEFWVRFLFSALVDADRLDSEAFGTPDRAALRRPGVTVEELSRRLDLHLSTLQQRIPEALRGSPINVERARIVEACRRAADLSPGLFSLTVPTGGGKTLAAMAFGLRHAMAHGKRRVIVVIPYTSIIEQNAEVYRGALGQDTVLEHHSNLDPEVSRSRLGPEQTDRNLLAAENWDAPIVITTTVQFFESLFSNHPSRCRKLHAVAGSVVLLDEVQTLPPKFLAPILEGLDELARGYHCTIVLSTATPPALCARPGFQPGLANVRPIIDDTEGLASRLARVEYYWPSPGTDVLDWPELADALASEARVLVIVHRRADARLLARVLQDKVPTEAVFHLSALMCPAHRSQVLFRVRTALAEGRPCRLVSTQLVEAGVDLDFPVVYRALGGLDSVVQAAGRCNREGRLDRGKVIVFRAPTQPPAGTPRRALQIVESMLMEGGGTLDASSPAACERFFGHLYASQELDVARIQVARQQLDFASVGRDFRLIEDGFTNEVVVPFGDAARRIDTIRRQGPTRDGRRALQPFVVSVHSRSFQALEQAGALDPITEGLHTLSPMYQGHYDLVFGLKDGDEPVPDPSVLVT